MKKFYKRFTLLITAFAVLFAFTGMAMAKDKGAAIQGKKAIDIVAVKTEKIADHKAVLVAKHIDPGNSASVVDTSAEVTPYYTTDRADSSCIIIVNTWKSEGGAASAATFATKLGVVQVLV